MVFCKCCAWAFHSYMSALQLQSLKKVLGQFNGRLAVLEFDPLSLCTILIGVMLSTSLLYLSVLFGGGRGWIWVEEGFKLHVHYCLETAVALCEGNKVQNGLSVTTHFFNDCSSLYSILNSYIMSWICWCVWPLTPLDFTTPTNSMNFHFWELMFIQLSHYFCSCIITNMWHVTW